MCHEVDLAAVDPVLQAWLEDMRLRVLVLAVAVVASIGTIIRRELPSGGGVVAVDSELRAHRAFLVQAVTRRPQCPVTKRFRQGSGEAVSSYSGKANPLTMLLSYPGSGNTWVRASLENVTGTSSPICLSLQFRWQLM